MRKTESGDLGSGFSWLCANAGAPVDSHGRPMPIRTIETTFSDQEPLPSVDRQSATHGPVKVLSLITDKFRATGR